MGNCKRFLYWSGTAFSKSEISEKFLYMPKRENRTGANLFGMSSIYYYAFFVTL